MKRITIEDVAKAAGVSRQTVSRAMNDKDEIRPATKARVMAAVETLGYVPNRLAQAMVTRSTRTVGLIIGDIMNLFFAEVTRGVQDLAQAHDYHVIIYNTDDDHQGELRALRSLTAQGVDGILGFLYNISDEELTRFTGPNRPLVLINRSFDHPNVETLIVDNRRGAKLAVDYLLAQGHTYIGMLTHIGHQPDQVRRVQGYQEALTNAGILHERQPIVQGYPTLEGGYQAAKELLTLYPDVTALFAYNDLMALGAVQAGRALDRQIPADLAIVGYDDILFSTLTNPALTTVGVHKYEIGKQAMKRFLAIQDKQMINAEFAPIEVELIIRESA